MRGPDYVVKRVFFAVATVFVAITLNFVLFRTLSGDAVSALRCRQCTQEFKDYQRKELGLDKSKFQQYLIYLGDLAHGNLGRSLRTERPVTTELWDPIKNTIPMVALGTILAIVFGSSPASRPPGGEAPGRTEGACGAALPSTRCRRSGWGC